MDRSRSGDRGESLISDDDSTDESAEIESLIASFQQGLQEKGESIDDDNTNASGKRKGRKKNSKKRTDTKRKPKPKRKAALNHLKQRVSELMAMFEAHGLWIPPPESLSEKGKVWSSRVYGADKKQQRKNAERMLVQDRIAQLESCLQDEHGISL